MSLRRRKSLPVQSVFTAPDMPDQNICPSCGGHKERGDKYCLDLDCIVSSSTAPPMAMDTDNYTYTNIIESWFDVEEEHITLKLLENAMFC